MNPLNDYTPTAFELALSIYTNAIVDMKHELNKARRDRLQWRANYALKVAAGADNPFPGWKLPKSPTSEPCHCSAVVRPYGYSGVSVAYPCDCILE